MENGNKPATKKDLEKLREELRQASKLDLEELRHEVSSKHDQLHQATKQDLEQLGQATRQALVDWETRLREAIAEATRDMETRLLNAFYSFAKSNDKHLRQLAVADWALTERVSTSESRLTEVEKRLNMPPAPPSHEST